MRVHFRVPALALLLAAGLYGCGSDRVTPPPPVQSPPPVPVTTTVAQGSGGGLADHYLMMVPFHTSNFGTIRANVDWTFAASTIYVYISPGQCSIDEINAGSCRFVAVSQVQSPKPRVVTATGQPAGDYTLYIGNAAGEEEAVSWFVSLTYTASSAADRSQPEPLAPAVLWRN